LNAEEAVQEQQLCSWRTFAWPWRAPAHSNASIWQTIISSLKKPIERHALFE